MKKNVIIILIIILTSVSVFYSCDALKEILGDSAGNSALFCVLPSQVAESLVPSSVDAGSIDEVENTSDDSNSTGDGLNSAVFMAGILTTAASQGTDLFNSVIKELSDVENLFEDEIFLTYEKDGKNYGVNIKNASQTCYITYGEVSAKSDKDYSNGDAISQFVYDPREQDKGPNMSILLDEYSMLEKSKSNGARYIKLDIQSSSSKQDIGVQMLVEGDLAELYESIGGKITFNKSSKLYEIEGIIKGHPLETSSSLNPKFRVFGVVDDTNAGAISAKLEDFGLQYSLGKNDLLEALGIPDPIPFINPSYTFTASLDYEIRNFFEVNGIPTSIKDIRIKSTKLELTKATATAESFNSSTPGVLNFLPDGEIDLTGVVSPMLSINPSGTESSYPFYDKITDNGKWKSYSISDSELPTKTTFHEIND